MLLLASEDYGFMLLLSLPDEILLKPAILGPVTVGRAFRFMGSTTATIVALTKGLVELLGTTTSTTHTYLIGLDF